MAPKNIKFSVNDYDSDGNIIEEGIFLHFDGARVKAASSLKEFKTIIAHLQVMINEIETNYPQA